MLQHPQSSIVQDYHLLQRKQGGNKNNNNNNNATTMNGAVQAAKELFQPELQVQDPQMDAAVSLGTTIMAVTFDGGVILAADSRTSTGGYVANRTSNKLTKLTNNIYCCRSGSAADTQAIAESVNNFLERLEISEGRPIPVATAATICQNVCYANKWNISAGIIVGGYDDINGGTVYSIPSGGACVRLPYALGGSGSIFLYSFMDCHYREGMSKEECVDLCRRAVSHALSRDGSSGGVVRTITITKDGTEHSTTPWTAIPYCMERDNNMQRQVVTNEGFASTSKNSTENVRDSSKN